MPRKLVAVPMEPMESIEQKWVSEHGETFKNYEAAAKQLGVCKKTVVSLVRDGYLQVTPMKKILVRPAAAWANSNRPKRHRLKVV